MFFCLPLLLRLVLSNSTLYASSSNHSHNDCNPKTKVDGSPSFLPYFRSRILIFPCVWTQQRSYRNCSKRVILYSPDFFQEINKLLRRWPYSPDLAPSDYILFLNLKNWFGGTIFSFNEEIFPKAMLMLRSSTKLVIWKESRSWRNIGWSVK